jgi:hypothetical protein
MIVIVIRDGKNLSKKARFLIKNFSSNAKFLYLLRHEQNFFKQKNKKNTIYLQTKLSGIFLYYTFFMLIKSPKDLVYGLIRRIRKLKQVSQIRAGGFLSIVSQSLYQYWVRQSQEKTLLNFLNKNNVPTIFIIDEFFSLKTINLEHIINFGKTIYISSDFAQDFYSDNIVASKMIYNLEKSIVPKTNLVIACSERDKLKYKKMGIENVIYYPNLYLELNFSLCEKEEKPSICLVLKEHWGSRSKESLNKVMGSLASLPIKIKLYLIGAKANQIPSNVELHQFDFIPSKLEFLKILSKSWIGINIGIHLAGTNERKYDYAFTGLIVLSDTYGGRGDFIPNEYTFVDYYDLTAKLNQILKLDKNLIIMKGLENRNHVIAMSNKQQNILIKSLENMQNQLFTEKSNSSFHL